MILLALFPSLSPFVVLFSISTSPTLGVCPRLGFPQRRELSQELECGQLIWGSDSWDWVTSQSLGSMGTAKHVTGKDACELHIWHSWLLAELQLFPSWDLGLLI